MAQDVATAEAPRRDNEKIVKIITTAIGTSQGLGMKLAAAMIRSVAKEGGDYYSRRDLIAIAGGIEESAAELVDPALVSEIASEIISDLNKEELKNGHDQT